MSLLFGKSRLSSSQSLSPNFRNQKIYQRLIDNREFHLVEGNDLVDLFTNKGLIKSNYKIIKNNKLYDTEKLTSRNISQGFVFFEVIH